MSVLLNFFNFISLGFGLQASPRSDVIRVGLGLDKPPYVFEGSQVGIEPEVIAKAFETEDIKVRFINMAPARLERALLQHEIDVAGTLIFISDPKIHLSENYISYRNVAITLKNEKIKLKQISDLKDHTLVAFQNAKFALGPEFNEITRKASDYSEKGSQLQQTKILLSRRAEVFIGDLRIFNYFAHQLKEGSTEIEVHPLFKETHYSLAALKASLIQSFNKGLNKLKKNGELERIYKNYEKFEGLPKPRIN